MSQPSDGEPKVTETATFGRRAEIPLDLLTPEQKRAYDLVLSERSQAPVLHSVLAIDALPAAIACARLHARNVLSRWNLPDQADTVELIVSELVTNAVQATMGYDGRPPDSGEGGLPCVHLRLSSDRVFTLIEVQDENQDLPTPTQANPDDESGRGLMLVAALSRRCGWDLSGPGNGKIAWALVGRLPAGAVSFMIVVDLLLYSGCRSGNWRGATARRLTRRGRPRWPRVRASGLSGPRVFPCRRNPSPVYLAKLRVP
jgi:anti-sigma regulatory factor (Ser/Thr protein kinase)